MTYEEEKKTQPNPPQPGEPRVEALPVNASEKDIKQLRDQLKNIDDTFRDAPTPWINGRAIGFVANGYTQETFGTVVFVDPSAPKCELDSIRERVGPEPNLVRASRFIGLQTSRLPQSGDSASTYAPFRYNLPPVSAGTLGARVVVRGQEYVLSSNHVWAHNGRAREGTSITVPGVIDELIARPVIAKRSHFVPLQSAGWPYVWPPQGSANTADCSLAVVPQPGAVNITTPVALFPDIALLTSGDLFALSRAQVSKKGRATQQTFSRIRLIDLGIYIGFTFGTCYFDGLIGTFDDAPAPLASPLIFAAPGDSGSVVVVDDPSAPAQFRNRAVGLITARAYMFDASDNFIGYIIAMCPMDTVAGELAKAMPPVQGTKLKGDDLKFFV